MNGYSYHALHDPRLLLLGGIFAVFIALASLLTGEGIYFIPKRELRLVYRPDEPRRYWWTVATWYAVGILLFLAGLPSYRSSTGAQSELLNKFSLLSRPPEAALLSGGILLLFAIIGTLAGNAEIRHEGSIRAPHEPMKLWWAVGACYLVGVILIVIALSQSEH